MGFITTIIKDKKKMKLFQSLVGCIISSLKKFKNHIFKPTTKIVGLRRKKIIISIFAKLLKSNKPCVSGQYLLYYDFHQAGIGHLKSNLVHYFRESALLNRDCVLKNPLLHKAHNANQALNVSWERYFDFKRSKLPTNYLLYDAFINKKFTNKQVLIVGAQYQLSDEENQKYAVIIRDMRGFSLYRLVYEKLYPNQKPDVIFYPAKIIKDQADSVLKQLAKNFCAIHIRRSDLLIDNPTLATNTSAKNVLKKLQQYNPNNLPVFLMTDEKDPQFYDNLNTSFNIIRYTDFTNLIEVAKQGDNYLLFCIESLILSKAKVRICTCYNDLVEASMLNKARQRHLFYNQGEL